MVLDRYISRASPIHTLDPRVKLLLTVAFIVGNSLLPSGAWLAFGAAWLLTLVVAEMARLGAGFAVRRSFIALPFMLAGFSIVFATPGNPLAQIPFGNSTLIISDAGVVRFISLLCRTWLSVQMAILLTATTDFPAITHALGHLKVPAVLVAIIGFMYRYLFVLVDEAQRLLRARSARAAATPDLRAGGSIPWRAKVAGNMAGQLLVRGIERGDRVYNAMVARGYRGELLTLTPHTMTRRDWLWFICGLLLLGIIQVIGYFFQWRLPTPT